MNGAESLVQTLVDSEVRVCFANPGTSEMHFVAALDNNPDIRCVLCLFEGVASAAADGYARMTGLPAATLLHLGPGLANAGANLHNAMRASSPIVNIVGDHATYHRHLDAPLTSDIEGLARTWSPWVRKAQSALSVAVDAADAVAAARDGRAIATLILPADTAWNEAPEPAFARPRSGPLTPDDARFDRIARILERGEPTVLIMGGGASASASALEDVDRLAQKSGLVALTETSYSRFEAGAGRVFVDTVPYPVDDAVERLSEFKHCILVEADLPVGFFAYPGKPGKLLPESCEVHVLAHKRENGPEALARLAAWIGASTIASRHVALGEKRAVSTGPLTSAAIGASLANRLPAGAIISDESITTGGPILDALRDAAPHTRLQLTGGAIGIGLPLAVGAAVACPDRRVVVLQADGSGMYTLQALWTHAREKLDIVSIVLSNRMYEILRHELRNVGVKDPGEEALGMTSLRNPDLDWTALAAGMGVEAARATTAEEFDNLLERAFSRRGPFLIEADLVGQ